MFTGLLHCIILVILHGFNMNMPAGQNNMGISLQTASIDIGMHVDLNLCLWLLQCVIQEMLQGINLET